MTKNQKGFTLIELLIYVALTAIILGLFAGILVTVTRIGGEQANSTQVSSELNFLMSSIKQRIYDSSSINSVSNDSINLTTHSNPGTPTIIFFVANQIQLDEGGTQDILSSNNIFIDDLTFTDLSYADPEGTSYSIGISITASNIGDSQNKVTRTIQSTATPLQQAQ